MAYPVSSKIEKEYDDMCFRVMHDLMKHIGSDKYVLLTSILKPNKKFILEYLIPLAIEEANKK